MTKKEIAETNFRSGLNCAQSVVAAFCGDYGTDRETALKMSLGFGGGLGRTRSVCGAVTGALMVIGLNAEDSSKKQEAYGLYQKFAEEFRREFGSLVCADLLEGNAAARQDSPVPEERTISYYKKRPCAEIVACAAEILETLLYSKND